MSDNPFISTSPYNTPKSSPNSTTRKTIDFTMDLPERVRGQNNGEVNNGEVIIEENDIEVGNDDQLGEDEQDAYVSDDEDVLNINYGGRKSKRRRKSKKSRHRKSKKRRGRKSRRKSKKRSRRKY